MISGSLQLMENAVRLPPPVMLRLCKPCLSIMSIDIWINCIIAIVDDSSIDIDNCKSRFLKFIFYTHKFFVIFRGQSLGSLPGNLCGCVCKECG